MPVLWDRTTRRIVNNSEDDICRMFNDAFSSAGITEQTPDLFPTELESDHTQLSATIYETVNNGVYRAGFATRQPAYEQAAHQLFATLDQLEARLKQKRFLFGKRPLEVDWRLFCTLIRFDAVYHGHFKCNLRQIADYPHLQGYLQDLYQIPGVASTVDFDQNEPSPGQAPRYHRKGLRPNNCGRHPSSRRAAWN